MGAPVTFEIVVAVLHENRQVCQVYVLHKLKQHHL